MDLSGLVRSPHEPLRGSPLKQSVTSSKLQERLIAAAHGTDLGQKGLDEEVHAEGYDDELPDTPTKKVKYATHAGVDLASAAGGLDESMKRKRGDMSAFFALRPGSPSGVRPTPSPKDIQSSPMTEHGLSEMRNVRRHNGEGRPEKKKKSVPRRDWAYGEIVWESDAVIKANESVLDKVRSLLRLLPVRLI